MTPASFESPADYRHQAFLYSGEADFAHGAAAFVRGGLAADEAVMVVVPGRRVDVLRDELGDDARDVTFADMTEVGRNPARLIGVWQRFVRDHGAGRGVRGIGEPVWSGRTAAELAECQRHEALLNIAFDGVPRWWLLCPYDTSALPADVVEVAARTHPVLLERGEHVPSAGYDPHLAWAPFDQSLPPAPPDAVTTRYDAATVPALRRLARERALAFGLDAGRVDDLVLAVHEVAANTLRHADGTGTLRLWSEDDTLVCELRDGGHVDEPLAGRIPPASVQERGRGLWLVHHLCDFVQVRSGTSGTVVRLHLTRADVPANSA